MNVEKLFELLDEDERYKIYQIGKTYFNNLSTLTVKEWYNSVPAPTRLINFLHNHFRDTPISRIERRDFMRMRGSGPKLWEIFITLRGF